MTGGKMNTISQMWSTIAAALKNSPRQSATATAIPRNHIDENQNGEAERVL